MGISMSSPTSGFRKWSEAHDPKIAGARAVAGEPAVILVPALDQAIMTPEEQPHRPLRVPVRSEANSGYRSRDLIASSDMASKVT